MKNFFSLSVTKYEFEESEKLINYPVSPDEFESHSKIDIGNNIRIITNMFCGYKQPLDIRGNFVLTNFEPAKNYHYLLKGLDSLPIDELLEYEKSCILVKLSLSYLGVSDQAESCYDEIYPHLDEIQKLEKQLDRKFDDIYAKLSQSEHVMVQKRIDSFDFSIPDKSLSIDNIWRLLVDGRKQLIDEERGWQGYEEREPGCLVKLSAGFLGALQNTEPLTFQTLFKIHDSLALSVGALAEGDGDLLRSGVTSRIGVKIMSLVGLIENDLTPAANYRLIYNPNGEDENFSEPILKRNFVNMSKKDLIMTIDSTCHNYEENISNKVFTDYQLLREIVQLCATLVRLHPFIDGNTRAFVTILLNRELIRHNFPPCILYDPNLFDNFSIDELINEVLNGIENYRYVCQNDIYPNTPPELLFPNWQAILTEKDHVLIQQLVTSLPKRTLVEDSCYSKHMTLFKATDKKEDSKLGANSEDEPELSQKKPPRF